MKKLLSRLHSRLGDFWWYTLMIFIAARAADALNVFVGLYLVPKYVDPSELGAVMPLTQFATFLAIPAAVFASTFRQELTELSVNRRFGQMKSLMRGVFIATAIFFLAAIVISHFILPYFLERIRIVNGSLGLTILAASFIGTISPIYTNALQSLKKFRAYSLINVFCAPVRLVTMIVMMPFRALTGYFVGQAATPFFTIGASVVALRHELAVPAEPYWNRTIAVRFLRLLGLFGLSALVGGAATLVETTIIRQRLPELDSAAYYMVTRFSEMSTMLSSVLLITVFPYAADLAARNQDNRPLILKCMAATLAFGGALAAMFAGIGRPILSLLPNGQAYAEFAWAIPVTIMTLAVGHAASFYTTAEIAANRFGFMWWTIPINIIYALLLLCVTGHAYFQGILPEQWNLFLANHNILSLRTMFTWMICFQVVRFAYSCVAMFWRNYSA